MLLRSRFERKLRRHVPSRLPFGSGTWLSAGANVVVKIALGMFLVLAPMILLAEFARSLQLQMTQAMYLLYMVGILLGKSLRFFYWYRKREWA